MQCRGDKVEQYIRSYPGIIVTVAADRGGSVSLDSVPGSLNREQRRLPVSISRAIKVGKLAVGSCSTGGSPVALRDFCGTFLCFPVLSCARRSQRPSSHTVSDQLRFRHAAQFRSRARRPTLTRRRWAVRARQHPLKSINYRAAARTPRAHKELSGTASSRSPKGKTCSPSYRTTPLWK
jgi:hypothetical protein